MKKANDFFDKIPDNLKSRIYTEEIPGKQRLLRPIIKAMVKGIAVEFLYKTKDGDEIYVLTAPVCLKEFEKNWYLLGDNKYDDAGIRIYALNKIRSLDEEWTTFSIPQIDYHQFMDRRFDINKVE